MEKLDNQGEQMACATIKMHMVGSRLCLTVERFDRDQFTLGELTEVFTHADPGEVERLRAELEEWKQRCQYNADTAHDVAKERDTLRAEADRLRQEVASIDKKLRGNVSDPDPLKPIMPGALSVTTTYGLVAGIVRERDQLKKALERQPS